MPSLPKEVADFMNKYGVTSDEVWPVPGGKSYAVKHKALERIAMEHKITFDQPQLKVCDLEKGLVVVFVSGKMDEKNAFSFGEASPKNNRNAYPVAMAEKRAVDRVILKLLSAHGTIYSEDELDNTKQKDAPDGYIDNGETIPPEHIITRDDGIQVLTMDAQRPIFIELERELLDCHSVEELKRWKVSARRRASRLSDHWKDDLNKRYLEYLRTLEKRDAIEYQERMAG
jgi:hypothetical protein